MPLSFKTTGNATGSGTAGVKVVWCWMVVITNSSFLGDYVVLGGVAGITWYFCAGVGVTASLTCQLAATCGGVE